MKKTKDRSRVHHRLVTVLTDLHTLLRHDSSGSRLQSIGVSREHDVVIHASRLLEVTGEIWSEGFRERLWGTGIRGDRAPDLDARVLRERLEHIAGCPLVHRDAFTHSCIRIPGESPHRDLGSYRVSSDAVTNVLVVAARQVGQHLIRGVTIVG